MARGAHPSLDRAAIARAALSILDTEGARGLTVRAIAALLGVQSPSLYNHVSSKDEILDAVTELIGGEIDLSGLEDPDWRRGVAAFARSYRSAFRAHPEALALIVRRAVETEAGLATYDAVLRTLVRAGWPPGEALRCVASIDYLVLGSALVPFTGGFVRASGAYAGRYPSLAAALASAPDHAEVDEAGFELGLAALLRDGPPV